MAGSTDESLNVSLISKGDVEDKKTIKDDICDEADDQKNEVQSQAIVQFLSGEPRKELKDVDE